MKRKKFFTKSKSKKNSKQLRKYIAKIKEETGINERRCFVKVTCNICLREYKIRINSKSDKTTYINKADEWVCLLCRDTWKHRLLKKGLLKRDILQKLAKRKIKGEL